MADVNAGQPPINAAIFPILATWCRPANLGTADCAVICRCDDQCDYAIKTQTTHPLLPHSEWLCSELAEAVGIATPPHRVIDLRDGSLAFGSRWQGGVLTPSNGGNWWEKVKEGTISLIDIQPVLSRIYAFDQFIYNVDRHCGNFIFHDQHEGYALLAPDYSRAWACNDFPLPGLPLPYCNTVRAQRGLRAFWNTDYILAGEVNTILKRISEVQRSKIQIIIESHPENWLPETMKHAILDWWGTPDMLTRLDGIAEGIRNGTYL